MEKIAYTVVAVVFLALSAFGQGEVGPETILERDRQLRQNMQELAETLAQVDPFQYKLYEKVERNLEAILTLTGEYQLRYERLQSQQEQLVKANELLQLRIKQLEKHHGILQKQSEEHQANLQKVRKQAAKYRRIAIHYKKKAQQRKATPRVEEKNKGAVKKTDKVDPGQVAQPDMGGTWYTASGMGFTKDNAVVKAWWAAMYQCLEAHCDAELLRLDSSRIKQFLIENWQKYTVGDLHRPLEVRPYAMRKITIKVQIREEQLLHDINRNFAKVRKILRNVNVLLISEEDSNEREQLIDQEVMFRAVHEHLGEYMNVQSSLASLNLPNVRSADVLIYLWVDTKRWKDPYLKQYFWLATAGCRGVKNSGEELWRFDVSSGPFAKPVSSRVLGDKLARSQAIKNVVKVLSKKIVELAGESSQLAGEDEYHIQFHSMFSSSQRQYLQNAIVRLSSGRKPYFKVKEARGDSAQGLFSLRVKWLHQGDSQAEVIQIVNEICNSNGLPVQCTKFSPGEMTFYPR